MKSRFNYYRGLKQTVAPAQEPATIAELKARLALDSGDTSEDTMLTSFVAAARERVESYTGRSLITQTWQMALDDFPAEREEWFDGVREMPISELRTPSRWIELPKHPLQSVTSITQYDTSETANVVDSDVYNVDTFQEPARIALGFGQVWPAITLRSINGIIIEFIAGYGDDPADVPTVIREAILASAAYMYEHRGACSADKAFKESGAADMLNDYRVKKV